MNEKEEKYAIDCAIWISADKKQIHVGDDVYEKFDKMPVKKPNDLSLELIQLWCQKIEKALNDNKDIDSNCYYKEKRASIAFMKMNDTIHVIPFMTRNRNDNDYIDDYILSSIIDLISNFGGSDTYPLDMENPEESFNSICQECVSIINEYKAPKTIYGATFIDDKTILANGKKYILEEETK